MAGLDEVGMGCLAGPICACAVVFPVDAEPIEGVTDSKKLSPERRAALAPRIMKEAMFFGIGWAHPTIIDTLGMSEAWRRACLDALEGAPKTELLMIDGLRQLEGFGGEQQSIVKGDAKVWQIGAASIVAKVVRDLEMSGMHRHHPSYHWNQNMGYGSQSHLEALFRLGPTHYHRGLFLRSIWRRHSHRIMKEQPSWMRWERDWSSAPGSDLSLEDSDY